MNDQLVRDGRAPVIGQVDGHMRLSKPDIPWRGRHHGRLGNEVRVERRYSVAAEALVRLSHCNILGRHQHLVELLARAQAGVRDLELGAQAKAEYRYEDAVILPGLRDSHFHPVGYTAALNGTTIGGIVDLAQMRDVLGTAAARIAPGDALIATRFDDAAVAERRLPTRADLDRATGAMPTLVHRYCGHVAIANTVGVREVSA